MTYSGASYFDSTRALERGEISPRGIDLTYAPVRDTNALFGEVARGGGGDISEMSLSTYLILRSRGDERLTGIPVFPARAFRHRHVYVHSAAGIEAPADLVGKNVGIPHYQMTAALWVRGFLQHDFGVSPPELCWWEGGLTVPVHEERLEIEAPKGVRMQRVASGATLEDMLERGALDALITTREPACLAAGALVTRLFPDYRAVELAYYERTKVVPLMHLVVIKSDIYRREPWIAAALLEAFEESRLEGRRRIREELVLPLTHPWIAEETAALEQHFGGDPFAHGVDANRVAIETAAELSYEQGLAARKLVIEDMFAAETMTWRSAA